MSTKSSGHRAYHHQEGLYIYTQLHRRVSNDQCSIVLYALACARFAWLVFLLTLFSRKMRETSLNFFSFIKLHGHFKTFNRYEAQGSNELMYEDERNVCRGSVFF